MNTQTCKFALKTLVRSKGHGDCSHVPSRTPRVEIIVALAIIVLLLPTSVLHCPYAYPT